MIDFRLANANDEPELRRLSALPIPGRWLDLSYQRNPDFFESLNSPDDQVLVGRLAGQLIAMAVRSPVPLLVGGQARPMAYLGGWRIAPQHQGRPLLFAGFDLLHRLQREHPVEEYLATIVEGNRLAQQLLELKGRPRFHPAGRLHTLALETFPGSAERADAQEDFVIHHARRAFFPARPGQHAAERRSWLVHEGVAGAIRDLSACRQTVVHRYRGLLRWLRPLYNLVARCPLPPEGAALRGAYLGFWASDGHRPEAFQGFLRRALALAHRQRHQWLYLGLMQDDPYLPVARRFRHRLYLSQLYRVRYQGVPDPYPEPCAYLELAWL